MARASSPAAIDKGLALLPPAPALKIQFYGDSITDGNAVDATSEDCSPAYWKNYLTYAPEQVAMERE